MPPRLAGCWTACGFNHAKTTSSQTVKEPRSQATLQTDGVQPTSQSELSNRRATGRSTELLEDEINELLGITGRRAARGHNGVKLFYYSYHRHNHRNNPAVSRTTWRQTISTFVYVYVCMILYQQRHILEVSVQAITFQGAALECAKKIECSQVAKRKKSVIAIRKAATTATRIT